MVDYGLDAQAAIDFPRFNIKPNGCYPPGSGGIAGDVHLEEFFKDRRYFEGDVFGELRKQGHSVVEVGGFGRTEFGRA